MPDLLKYVSEQLQVTQGKCYKGTQNIRDDQTTEVVVEAY